MIRYEFPLSIPLKQAGLKQFLADAAENLRKFLGMGKSTKPVIAAYVKFGCMAVESPKVLSPDRLQHIRDTIKQTFDKDLPQLEIIVEEPEYTVIGGSELDPPY